jgi:UDP-glucose 4-epimerase
MSAPILVTGGTGAIGRYVVHRLVSTGHRVVVYSRRAPSTSALHAHPDVVHAPGDVQDLPRLCAVLKEHRVRRVVHLAAMVGPRLEYEPSRAYSVNLMGSLAAFEAARTLGLERIVFVSSKTAYGAFTGDYAPPTFQPVPEDYVGETVSVYGATKRALEDAARHYRRLFGLDLIALRLGSTYGPGKDAAARAGGYSALKSRMVESAVHGEPLLVQGLDTRDDVVYNADVAKGVVLACFARATEHWQFNISSGKLVSLREFAEEVRRCVPASALREDRRSAPLRAPSACLLSIDRARAELDFEPDFPGVSGVAEYVRLLQRA